MAREELITIVPDIDPDIAEMIPPLAPEEEAGLEADLIAAGGARGPLDVWLNPEDGRYKLLDGHNRKRLCERHGLRYSCRVEPRVKTREDALAFVTSETVNRRNVTPLARAVLIGRQYNREKAPGTRTDLHSGARSRAAERLGKRYGISPRSVELCARAATALDVVTKELATEAREVILRGGAKVTREDLVELGSIKDPDLMRKVWDEWLDLGQTGLTRIIARHKSTPPSGPPNAMPKPAPERFGLASLVHLLATRWTITAYAKRSADIDDDLQNVIDRNLVSALWNLLQIGRARELAIGAVIEEWLAQPKDERAVARIRANAVGSETPALSERAPELAPSPPVPADRELAAGSERLGLDLNAIREHLHAALNNGIPMKTLAREVGVTPQTLKGFLGGSEPYAKVRSLLAEWHSASSVAPHQRLC